MTIKNRYLLPLTYRPDVEEWRAETQVEFKPRGLMLWDLPPGATIVQAILVGPRLELVAQYAPIPARWFTQWQSYAEIAKAIDDGLEPPGWGDWTALTPGMVVSVRLEDAQAKRLGPPVQAVMWGEGE